MTKRYMTYDGEGLEMGQLTLEDASAKFASAELDVETGTITVSREQIRHGSFGPIVWDGLTGATRMATQEDLDTAPGWRRPH